jgi:hypothetical protein
MIEIGVEYTEAFAGSFYYLEKPEVEIPINVKFTIHARSLRAFLSQRSVTLRGMISSPSFGENEASLTGTVGFKMSARRVPYEFWFQSGTQGRLRFLGEKDIHIVWPRESIELLTASLFDEYGAELGRARLRFDLRREAWNTLRSVRPKVRLSRGTAA